MNFKEKVLKVVSDIPSGKTMSYADVAITSGNPKAARAVGRILNSNYDSAIPCHRVIYSNGSLGGYNRGAVKKGKLLATEGVIF